MTMLNAGVHYLPFVYLVFPDIPRPAPPIIGKVTHHSIEMYWDENIDKAMAVCDKGEGRIRVCLQEHDKSCEWGNLYS